MKSIAFFDVDHTLVNGNSGYYTSLRLVHYGILKQRRILQAVYYSLASLVFHQDVKKIYQIAVDDMAGTPLDLILKIGRESFEKDVKQRLYADGLRQIKDHKKKGHGIILLTAAPHMLINTFEKFIGADESHCMGPEIVGGVLTNHLCLPLCHGEGKVHFAKLAAKKYGVPLSECFFYTDHHSDIPLLEIIGNPRVVNPNRKLERTALSRGWPILRFR